MEVFRMGEAEETSECSSGCESGWTMYLDQTTDENLGSTMNQKKCDLEEEDLSIVSDASSGPPHFHDDEAFCYCNQRGKSIGCFCSASSQPSAEAALITKGSKKRRIGVELQHQFLKQREESNGFLDDTASSPILGFPNKNIKKNSTTKDLPIDDILEISYGFSATHFKVKSTFYNQFGYLKRNVAKPDSGVGGWKNNMR